MASSPDILDELPWLTASTRKTRKALVMRHGKSALLLTGLAAPLLIANGHYGWTSSDPGLAPAAKPASATPALIDDPFAPKALRPLSAEEAEKWNSAIPDSATGISAATPFAVGEGNAQSLSRSLQCMTAAIYYEAGNEPLDGQRAVAQVVLNRMRSPIYPHSVCGVVYQGSERKTGCQFTFTCDGSLARTPSTAGWARAGAVAIAALSGYVYAPVGWATHYHADYVVPYWAQTLDKVATIGRHIFYRWTGRNGSGTAFTSHYAGLEPDVAARLALASPDTAAAGVLDGAIVHVSAAERPVIDFTVDAKEGADKAKKVATVAAAHPDTAPGARWVIGSGPAASSLGQERHIVENTAAAVAKQGAPSIE